MVRVAGYSGIGKSVLVHEMHKPITAKRGYFISGKFDQFKRNEPYFALIQAFQALIRQLLTGSQEQIELWKEKLLDALGPNGQVIIDVISEVELITGEQPAISLAIWRVAGRTSAAGRQRLASPMAAASSPVTIRLV